ncbi:unnamed protein product [Caenorhabditis angaria]|uniref:PDZ domain-containing protein n=1 Tax=Caenorhabditis angaria TaxID=860376 RepID=A0A9P1II66_9PELO|nr:unnamed protein product [Caenorhabditis angaria]
MQQQPQKPQDAVQKRGSSQLQKAPTTNNPPAANNSSKSVYASAISPMPRSSMQNQKRMMKTARSPVVEAPNSRPSGTNVNVNSLAKNRRRIAKKAATVSCESQELSPRDNLKTQEEEVSLEEDVSDTPFTKDSKDQPKAKNYWQTVKIEIAKEDLPKLYEMFIVNRNMILEAVSFDGMPYFIFGDQIHEVNGHTVHTRRYFEAILAKVAASGQPLVITVIRAWNVRCATKAQLSLLPTVNEQCSYFIVRVHRFFKTQGFVMKLHKKKINVQDVRPGSNGSFAFFHNDRILDVENSNAINGVSGKPDVKSLQKLYNKGMKERGYVDVFVSRVIGAHTSPNPSIQGELENAPPKTTQGPQVLTADKKVIDAIDLPLESDAVEIALRELYRIQILTQTTEGGPVKVPPTKKGKSLLRPIVTIPSPQAAAAAAPSAEPTRSIYKEQPNMEKSLYEPYAKMPRTKRGKWTNKKNVRQSTINFKETTETSKILSDIPDDVELKKVDARSGIVAYIRNAFGGEK